MSSNDTKFDILWQKLKNRYSLAILATIGIIVISLATFTGAIKHLFNILNLFQKDVEIVDVTIIDDPFKIKEFKENWIEENTTDFNACGSFPIIDVKLRNKGKQIAFLKAINFNFTRIDVVEYDHRIKCAPIPPSWEYNVILENRFKISERIKLVRLDLSQSIGPNKVDRFVITVGQNRFEYAIYKINPVLIYNIDEKINLGKFLLKIVGPSPCDSPWKLKYIRRPSNQKLKKASNQKCTESHEYSDFIKRFFEREILNK